MPCPSAWAQWVQVLPPLSVCLLWGGNRWDAEDLGSLPPAREMQVRFQTSLPWLRQALFVVGICHVNQQMVLLSVSAFQAKLKS